KDRRRAPELTQGLVQRHSGENMIRVGVQCGVRTDHDVRVRLLEQDAQLTDQLVPGAALGARPPLGLRIPGPQLATAETLFAAEMEWPRRLAMHPLQLPIREHEIHSLIRWNAAEGWSQQAVRYAQRRRRRRPLPCGNVSRQLRNAFLARSQCNYPGGAARIQP